MTMNHEDFVRILVHGFKYGHLNNPKYPDLQNFTAADLFKVDQKHPLAQQLVKSVQESDYVLEEFAQAHHNRNLIIDGDPGPATLALVDVPRCDCVDFGPGAGLRLDDNMALEEIGTGTGSWLHSCHPDFPNIHTIVMALQKSNMQSQWKDNLEEILRAITKAWHEIGAHPIWKFDHSGEANMKISWGRLSGYIGWNIIPRSFSCNLSITGKIATNWSPSDLRMLGRLALHEWSLHGFGYGHTRGGIGNPSILPGEVTWIGDQLEDRLKKNFGGPITDPGGFQDWGSDEWL